LRHGSAKVYKFAGKRYRGVISARRTSTGVVRWRGKLSERAVQVRDFGRTGQGTCYELRVFLLTCRPSIDRLSMKMHSMLKD